ncbi:UNKNOWN [Stylonychia lemnae]|uniref:Cyclic nucleotide-binding domain-containing protein n=1 Tax=Stylonychia lemnae TaxID=5949 RepID=A0A078AQF9_STYLE|nr:UNKNOWN [Stylonychia lemnae]|eukprot:CDW84186.1 UNKNOWN [Stylonychia lemnae]
MNLTTQNSKNDRFKELVIKDALTELKSTKMSSYYSSSMKKGSSKPKMYDIINPSEISKIRISSMHDFKIEDDFHKHHNLQQYKQLDAIRISMKAKPRLPNSFRKHKNSEYKQIRDRYRALSQIDNLKGQDDTLSMNSPQFDYSDAHLKQAYQNQGKKSKNQAIRSGGMGFFGRKLGSIQDGLITGVESPQGSQRRKMVLSNYKEAVDKNSQQKSREKLMNINDQINLKIENLIKEVQIFDKSKDLIQINTNQADYQSKNEVTNKLRQIKDNFKKINEVKQKMSQKTVSDFKMELTTLVNSLNPVEIKRITSQIDEQGQVELTLDDAFPQLNLSSKHSSPSSILYFNKRQSTKFDKSSQDNEDQVLLNYSFNQAARKDEQEVQRSYIQNYLKTKIEDMVKKTSEVFTSSQTRPKQTSERRQINDFATKLQYLKKDSQFNELKQTIFPIEIQQRSDFKEFVETRYQDILKSSDRTEIQIVEAMFYESESDDVIVLKLRNLIYEKMMEDYLKKKKLKLMKFLGTLPFLKDQTAGFFDDFLNEVNIQTFKKGDNIYKENEHPKYFWVVLNGTVHVQKEIQVQYTNYWPKGHQMWNMSTVTQKVNKTIQIISRGQYFGEEEILTNHVVSCNVVAGSENVELIGFTRDCLKKNLSSATISNWLRDHVLVKFQKEKDILKQALIDKKIKQMHQNAFLNSTQTNPIDGEDRSSYVPSQIIKMQRKIKPWLKQHSSLPVSPRRGSPERKKNFKLNNDLLNNEKLSNLLLLERGESVIPELDEVNTEFSKKIDARVLSLRGYQKAMSEKQDLYDKEMAEKILKQVFENKF